MSFSDTANAKKYAAQAEVSAAQCALYTEEARKAPDYTNEAKQYADASAASASSAAESLLLSQNAASGAGASAIQSQEYANKALTYLNQFEAEKDDFATLDENGKILASQLPSIAISETYTVNSEAEMLSLSANVGDVAIRIDLGSTAFLLASLPPTSLTNWKELLTSPVSSVNGEVGAVVLSGSDISLSDSTTIQGRFDAIADEQGFRYVGSVKSMKELSGINGAYDGQKILVESYHPDVDRLAGGILYWRASGAKSSHNGFTIFDPDKSYPTDWTVRSQRVTWYTPSSSGVGIWVRPEKADDLTVDFAGAKPYNSSQVDTESFNALISTISVMSDILLSSGTYRANIKPRAGIRGLGYSTIMVPDVQATPIVTLEYINSSFASNWCWKVIRDINFSSESTDGSVGYNISYTTDTSVPSYANVGRYYFKNIILSNAFAGIRKPYGNIGNLYEGLATQNVSYGVWARGKSDAPVMHEGNDTFIRCHFNKCFKAGYRADVTVYGSSLDTQFIGCIFEYNDGFGVLLRGAMSNHLNVGTLRILGGHFEGNGTVGATVDIEGVMLQPVDIYSQNIRYINISDVLISSCTLINSSLTAHRCQFSDVRGSSYYYFSIDSASQIDSYEDGSQFGRPLVGLVVHSVSVPNFNSRNGFIAEHRKTRAFVSISSPNGFSKNFDGSSAIPSYSPVINSTQVQDAMLGQYSSRWTIPASTTVILTNPSSMVMTAGRFYVWSFSARWISGDATIQVAQSGGATLSQPLPKGGYSFWKTFAGVGLHTDSGDNTIALRVNGDSSSSTVIQTADFQIMTFTSLSEALNWMNSGQCLGRT
ncbi:hypothetical protein ACXGQP_04305 [Enterobacter oligotrophicus]